MTVDELKAEIRKLPRKEVGPQLPWLRNYFGEEPWARRIAADIALPGEAEFVRRLLQGAEPTEERRQAARQVRNHLRLAPH